MELGAIWDRVIGVRRLRAGDLESDPQNWLSWPARVGPELAAELGVDARELVAALDVRVVAQLAELASERAEF